MWGDEVEQVEAHPLRGGLKILLGFHGGIQ
jgi:hypothetical protein